MLGYGIAFHILIQLIVIYNIWKNYIIFESVFYFKIGGVIIERLRFYLQEFESNVIIVTLIKCYVFFL